MRPVLVLAVCLLVLTVLLNLAGRLAPSSPRGPGAEELIVQVFAKGPLLPAARMKGGDEIFDEAILIGDTVLDPFDSAGPQGPQTAFSAIRFAAAQPSGARIRHGDFDVAHSAAAVEALRRACDAVPLGGVAILVGRGDLRPATAEARSASGSLARLLSELKSEGEPWNGYPVSWALITLRRPSGWVRLAEARSGEVGVALAFTVAAAREIYDGSAGEYLIEHLEGPASVRLDRELDVAAVRPGRAWHRPVSLAGFALPSLGVPLWDQSTSFRWEEVELGSKARFEAGVGMIPADGDPCSGRFELRVDGRRVGTVAWPGPTGEGWRSLLVDLEEFSGRTVSIELLVSVDEGSAQRRIQALWGQPTLRYEADGP